MCIFAVLCVFVFFFFNDTATTEIYTLSLHDALPICSTTSTRTGRRPTAARCTRWCRSEEHTSELQSRQYLVCSLLLEKKKKNRKKDRTKKTRKHERKEKKRNDRE